MLTLFYIKKFIKFYCVEVFFHFDFYVTKFSHAREWRILAQLITIILCSVEIACS